MKKTILLFISLGFFVLAACAPASEPTPVPDVDAGEEETAVVSDHSSSTAEVVENERFSADKYAEYEIVTLLPRDAIPAIDNPNFVSAEDADSAYDDDELVIGVAFNGDARAYSVPLLSSHEIVNDTVGGEKIAVTW